MANSNYKSKYTGVQIDAYLDKVPEVERLDVTTALTMTYMGSGTATSNNISLKAGDVVKSITTTATNYSLVDSSFNTLTLPYTAVSDKVVLVSIMDTSAGNVPGASVTISKKTVDELAHLETQIGQVGDVLDAINGEEV